MIEMTIAQFIAHDVKIAGLALLLGWVLWGRKDRR